MALSVLKQTAITEPIRKRIRKRRILPPHVFGDVKVYKHIKRCKGCTKRFEDRYKARLYCDDCRK